MIQLILTIINKNKMSYEAEQPKDKPELIKEKPVLDSNNKSQTINIPCIDDIEKCRYNLKQLAERYYYYKMSIPIIEELSLSTKDFEEKTLKKVFDQFEEIWNESETIVKESEISMQSIFDTSKEENLGYILDSSKEINRDFTNFLPFIDSMSKETEEFVKISMESFDTISKTTKDIEDLAEQVKVISINVRIEAARIKDSGGFKVLGEDITNFADRTTQFAQSTNERIQNTVTEIEELKQSLSSKMNGVRDMVKEMYKKINPFEGILENSAYSLKNVVNDLNKVSGELNENLKQSLGNLQYQDVTRQETEHVIEFLKSLERSIYSVTDFEKLLSEEEKNKVKHEILSYLHKISTTGNEANKIEQYGINWKVKYKDTVNEDFASVDDGTFLF